MDENGRRICRRAEVQVVALVVLVLVVYGRVTGFDYVNHDDPQYVTENPHVRTGLTLANAKWALASLHGGISYWHPLTWISHQLDCQLFGLQAGAHHLTNVWIHAANAALVVMLLRAMGVGGRTAFLAAGLFAVHPLHVESVAWVAERKDVLYGLFWLAALGAFVRFRKSRRWRWYGGCLAGFILALMSKPTAVTLPLVMVVVELVRRWRVETGEEAMVKKTGSGWIRAGRTVWWAPLILLSLASAWLTIVAQASVGALDLAGGVLAAERLDRVLASFVVYVGKALFPMNLSVSCLPQNEPEFGLALVALGMMAAVMLVGWRERQRDPWILGGWLWFLLTLLPNSGLVQAGPQRVADRYTYIPLIGLTLTLVGFGQAGWRRWHRLRCGRRGSAGGADGRPGSSTWFPLGCAGLIGLCAVLSIRQLGFWRDSVTLFTRAVEVEPNNWVARLGLGMALTERGRFLEALRHLQRALDLPGNRYETLKRIGICYQWQQDDVKALEHYEQALRLRPGSTEVCLLASAVRSEPGAACPDPVGRLGPLQ